MLFKKFKRWVSTRLGGVSLEILVAPEGMEARGKSIQVKIGKAGPRLFGLTKELLVKFKSIYLYTVSFPASY